MRTWTVAHVGLGRWTRLGTHTDWRDRRLKPTKKSAKTGLRQSDKEGFPISRIYGGLFLWMRGGFFLSFFTTAMNTESGQTNYKRNIRNLRNICD